MRHVRSPFVLHSFDMQRRPSISPSQLQELEELRRMTFAHQASIADLKRTTIWAMKTLHYLEFFNGTDLGTWHEEVRPRRFAKQQTSLKFFTRLAAQMVLAVEAVHREGIIHNNIQPDSFLINDVGLVKLTDFSMAVDANNMLHAAGTPAFAAPERMVSHSEPPRYSYAADIYSLGKSWAYLAIVSGYDHPDLIDRKFASTDAATDALLTHVSTIFAPFKGLIRRMMAEEPSKRVSLDAIKEHPVFKAINWGNLESLAEALTLEAWSRNRYLSKTDWRLKRCCRHFLQSNAR